MFTNILVPTDLTEKGFKALEVAVDLAGQGPATVTLLHVIETIQDTDCDEFEDFYKKLGKRAVKAMDKILSGYRSDQIVFGREIAYGRRVKEILRFADARQADLIILSSHRVDVDDLSQGWGTISYKVGILSQCPVLLVK